MNLAIQRNDSLKLLAYDDKMSNVSLKMDDELESSFCPTHIVYEIDGKREWNGLFVINQRNFQQGVGICNKENNNCDGIDDYLFGATHLLEKNTFNFPARCCYKRYNKAMYDNIIY